MAARTDSAILHEIVRVIQERAQVPEKVRIRTKQYLITYLEDHRQRLEEAMRRHDTDRLGMLFGQLPGRIKYQMLKGSRKGPPHARPGAKPPTRPMAKPPTRPMAKPPTRPAAKPLAKTPPKPARKPPSKPTAKTRPRSAAKSGSKSSTKPKVKTAARVAGKRRARA